MIKYVVYWNKCKSKNIRIGSFGDLQSAINYIADYSGTRKKSRFWIGKISKPIFPEAFKIIKKKSA